MIWSLIFLILIASSVLTLAILVLKKNPLNKVNLVFFILSLSIFFWMIFVFCENAISDSTLASLFLRLDFASGPVMACSFLFLAYYFPERLKPMPDMIKIRSIALSLLFSFFSFGNLIINNLSIKENGIRYDEGPLYLFYSLLLLGFIVWSCALLIGKYFRYKGIKRLQILYILLGLGLSGGFAAIFNLFFANSLSVEVSRLAIYSFIIFIGCTAYAIIRYRLMDIRIIIQKGLIFSLMLLAISAIYSALVFVANLILGRSGTWSVLISAGISVVIIAFTLPVLENFLKKWTDKIFFKAPIDYRQAVREINELFATEIKLNSLVDQTLKFFKNIFKIEAASFIFCPQEKNAQNFLYHNRSKEKLTPSACSQNQLLQYFIRNKTPNDFVILDDLEHLADEGRARAIDLELIKSLQHQKMFLSFAVNSRRGFLGIVCLGRKKEESPYFQQDLDWFEIIGRQFGMALERALIYENLEVLVADRTVKLREANAKLKQISEAKSEFVSVASHQLKSPLTVVKDIFSLFLSHDLGKITDNQADYSQRGIKQIDKLIELVNMLLNISRIETGRINMDIKKNNLNAVVSERVKEYDLLAKSANLTVKFEPGEFGAFKFDRNLISEVVGNLIDNAIKYTPKGSLILSTEVKDHLAVFKIKDTGMGISKESMRQLFHRFVRGEDHKKLFIAGTGLGLYFCLRVIQAHGGKIWAESPGVDKGSAFIFELPI